MYLLYLPNTLLYDVDSNCNICFPTHSPLVFRTISRIYNTVTCTRRLLPVYVEEAMGYLGSCFVRVWGELLTIYFLLSNGEEDIFSDSVSFEKKLKQYIFCFLCS